MGINSLFASHIAIFGNTGSGKSYTLAKIYRELFLRYKDSQNFRTKARFFLLDFNGEYIDDESETDDVIVDEEFKNVYQLSTRTPEGGDKVPVTRDAIGDYEFWSVLLEATPKTQAPFLRRAIENDYTAERIRNADGLRALISQTLREATIEVDKTTERNVAVNFLKELNTSVGGNGTLRELITDYENRLKLHTGVMKYFYRMDDGQPIYSNEAQFIPLVIEAKVATIDIDPGQFTPIDEIRVQIVFQYYSDVVRGFSNREHIAPLIKRLDQRIDSLKKVLEVRRRTNSGTAEM